MIGLEQLQKRWLNFEDQPWCCGVGEVLVHSRGKGKLDSVFLFLFCCFFFSEIFVVTKNVKIER